MALTRRFAPVLAVTLLTVALHPLSPAGATPTYLDPTFGTSGVATLGGDQANAVVVQPDGRILVGGSKQPAPDDHDATVSRLLPNGAVDATFGTGGAFTLGDGGLDTRVVSLVRQTDGGIVAAVRSQSQPDGVRVDLVRLDAGGHLDPTFGDGGVVHRPYTFNVRADFAAVALQPDGKVLVTDIVDYPWPNHQFDKAVARYNADGTPDTAFGASGVAVVDFSTGDVTRNDFATAVAVLSDGRIVIGGWSDVGFTYSDVFALAALTPDGVLDPAFGSGGKVITAIPSAAQPTYLQKLAVQADGKLIAAGTAHLPLTGGGALNQAVFVRYTATGVIDPSFGSGGVAAVDMPPMPADIVPFGVTIDPSGRIVAAGGRSTNFTDAFAAIRLLPNGAPDPSFGGSGTVSTLVPTGAGHANAVALQPDGRIVAVGDAGGKATVVRYRTSSGVSSWGWNAVGQLGTGSTLDAHVPNPAVPLIGPDSVSAGAYHTLDVQGDGTVWSWGWNGLGQLGDGTTTDHAKPRPVPGLAEITAASAGAYHSLAVNGDDGTISAWGWNGVGQLGDGTTTDRHQPVTVATPTGARFVAVAAGGLHSLALDAGGDVWAWGWNGVGQLGDGTTTDHAAPARVPGLTDVVAISAGAYHSLALKSDGTVWAWGWNVVGQLGDGTTTDRHEPVQVSGLTNATAVSAGGYHSLALRSDGTVAAWGWNVVGQLGDGTTTDRHVPTSVPGVTGVAAISAGAFHNLAVRSDGTMRAWGWNGVSQLGDGTTTDHHLPVTVLGASGVMVASAGLAHSVAVRP